MRRPRPSGGHRPQRRLEHVVDPLTGRTAEIRQIQPYEARGPYVCPGCHQEIYPGTGHVVVIPLGASEDRRHWHRPCWGQRAQRPHDR